MVSECVNISTILLWAGELCMCLYLVATIHQYINDYIVSTDRKSVQ